MVLHPGLALNDAEYGTAFRRLLLEDLGDSPDPRHVLCLLLLVERARGPASPWQPYISTLPEAYDDPFWWPESDLRLLVGTRLGRAVEKCRPGVDKLAAHASLLEQYFRWVLTGQYASGASPDPATCTSPRISSLSPPPS